MGGYSKESNFKYFDKNLWIPIETMILDVKKKEHKSILEQELLSCCYLGSLYRIHRYNDRLKGYICPLGHFQSWTMEAGFNTISRMGGQILLICGHTNKNTIAINTFELLCFIIKNFGIEIPNRLYDPKNLCKYEEEYEIVMPMNVENIDNLLVVDSRNIQDWKTLGREIPREKWFRKKLY